MRTARALVKYRFVVLACTMLSAIALPLWSSASGQGSQDGRIIVAETADEAKKRKEKEDAAKSKPQPKPAPPVQPKPAPPVQPKPAPQIQPKPEPQVQPKPEPQVQPKPVPQVQPKPVPQVQPKPTPQVQPKPTPQVQPKPVPQVQPKPAPQVQPKPQIQPQPKTLPKQDAVTPKSEPQIQKGPAQVQPKSTPPVQPKQETVTPKGQPQIQKGPAQVQPKSPPPVQPKQETVTPKGQPQIQKGPAQVQPKGTQTPAGVVQPKAPLQQQPPVEAGKPKFVPTANQFAKPKSGFQKGNVSQIKDSRKVTTQGNVRIIVEPGNRRIIHEGNRIIIRNDDSARLRRWGNARFEVRGRERYTILQRGPYQIVTVTDTNGNLLRRFRRYPGGREVVFIDNRPRFGRAVGIGAAALFLGLAAPAITIPRDRYIVNAAGAPPSLLYETFQAPPLMAMERPYLLDEVRYNVELRDRMRSVDLDTITFATGSWEISPDQYPQLQALAEAILKVLSENADTVFLIEGHTDTVGPDDDNLSLSDRRAEAVADILTGRFQIPPENLVTQGYGKQHLRVQVQGPSRENRRVQVRNIAPLLGQGQEQDPNQDPGQDPGQDPPPGRNPG
jgi:outer membrane protein OmpA-like peptidoglycan-associated protein